MDLQRELIELVAGRITCTSAVLSVALRNRRADEARNLTFPVYRRRVGLSLPGRYDGPGSQSGQDAPRHAWNEPVVNTMLHLNLPSLGRVSLTYVE